MEEFDKNIQKLEEEMARLGILEDEVEIPEETVEMEEVATEANTVTIEEDVEPVAEEQKNTDVDMETKRLEVAKTLKNNYGIVEGNALYEAVMGAIEANEPIDNLAEFAKKQLQTYKILNKNGAFRNVGK